MQCSVSIERGNEGTKERTNKGTKEQNNKRRNDYHKAGKQTRARDAERCSMAKMRNGSWENSKGCKKISNEGIMLFEQIQWKFALKDPAAREIRFYRDINLNFNIILSSYSYISSKRISIYAKQFNQSHEIG